MMSGAVIALAMTLNELCTNTTKFGALSVPQGRVDIKLDAGSTGAAPAPYMDREEWRGSPPAPKAQLRDTADRNARQAAFRGDVRLTYAPTGFVCAFDVPMASLTSAAA